MGSIQPMAPTGDEVIEYDRRHLALYAALLDADEAGALWQDAAENLMQLDISKCDAEACWRSHVERARWIIGDGLASAILAFNMRSHSVGAK